MLTSVSILVLIEFIFNEDTYLEYDENKDNVSILVLIEFIFNTDGQYVEQEMIGLNPCFDRIYFQSIIKHNNIDHNYRLNPCFDRIYFQ